MTKHRIAHHLKGKIRDKVKQVILIDGIPEVLYRIREHKTAIIKFNNKKYRLDIPDDLIKELKKISTIEIEVSTRNSKSFNPILIPRIGNRTSIKAVNGNTHITVGGSDEQQLTERIQMVKEYLASLGVNSIERCHWVCSTDKAKSNEKILRTESIVRIKTPEQQQKITIPEAVIASTELKVTGMSEKTKSLRDIALKAIKKSEAKL